MLGVYADTTGTKSLFVVVTTNFFQDTFSGMLQWESRMPDDIKQYLFSNGQAPAPSSIANVPSTATNTIKSISVIAGTKASASTSSAVATSSAASSTSNLAGVLLPNTSIKGEFKDRIVMNKDVREFVTDSWQPLFLYSFVDNSRLVVTDKESTLAKVITRLENQALVR